MTGNSAGIVYSPRMNPMDSAILMHTELVPEVDGRHQDLISMLQLLQGAFGANL
jgi:hypothetical protein